jgi:hypothetical protein
VKCPAETFPIKPSDRSEIAPYPSAHEWIPLGVSVKPNSFVATAIQIWDDRADNISGARTLRSESLLLEGLVYPGESLRCIIEACDVSHSAMGALRWEKRLVV